jgi:anti-sigma regulatory factor (Ser/Thr protein kinase)
MAQISLELPATTDAPGQARHALRAVASSMSARDRWRAELIMTELVSNAVVHGPGGPVTVAIDCGGGAVRGRVGDPGPGVERRRDRAPESSESGRGLFLVDRLSDRWGTSPEASGVWFEVTARA